MNPYLKHASQAAQIFMVILIFVALVHLLQMIATETNKVFTPRPAQTGSAWTPDPADRYIRFLPDGTARQIHDTGERDPNGHGNIVEIYDENDTLITRGPAPQGSEGPYLSFPSRADFSSSKRRMNNRYTLTPEFSTTLDLPVFEGKTLREIWRYDRDRAIFAGYSRGGQTLGYLSQQGVVQTSAAAMSLGDLQGLRAGWSPNKNSLRLLWLTQHRLYEIDAKARRVECLADGHESPILYVSEQAWIEKDKQDGNPVDSNLYRPLIVCQSSDKTYHLALREPSQLITFSPPQAWTQFLGNCIFSATRTDLFMVRTWTDFRPYPRETTSTETRDQWYQEYRTTKKRHGTELYRMDMQGELEKLKSFSWMETQINDRVQVITRLPWTVDRCIRCVSPGLYAWTAIGRRQMLAYYAGQEQGSFFLSVLSFTPQGFWDYLIPSLLFAALAFGHGRPRWTSQGQAVFWLVFVLAFNLAGLLTYLALNHTAILQCSACGKKRGLGQDACPRCHAPLPEPTHTRPHLVVA